MTSFDGPVTIATTVSYLQRFRVSRILPQPARATTTGDVARTRRR